MCSAVINYCERKFLNGFVAPEKARKVKKTMDALDVRRFPAPLRTSKMNMFLRQISKKKLPTVMQIAQSEELNQGHPRSHVSRFWLKILKCKACINTSFPAC
ncbi:hypothetical protein TNCV_4949061 [Trichonephila clavipes]|nr:hypothetical protein TNCV_4949061 [Trichonephila clavipes]